MLLAGHDFLPRPFHTKRISFEPLKKPTVTPNDIIHTILRCSVEFYRKSVCNFSMNIMDSIIPSNAKTIGLSGLEGSVQQKTSARPSEASRSYPSGD